MTWRIDGEDVAAEDLAAHVVRRVLDGIEVRVVQPPRWLGWALDAAHVALTRSGPMALRAEWDEDGPALIVRAVSPLAPAKPPAKA